MPICSRLLRLRRLAAPALVAWLLATACGGPRMELLTEQHYPPLRPDERVDVYVGTLDPPYESIAVVESEPYPTVTDAVKARQLEQLEAKARQLGANTLHEVRILSKRVQGMTPDERVPFSSWRQGEYSLYFMRATAIRRAPREPDSLAEAEPADGWATQGYPTPARLRTSVGAGSSPTDAP